MANDFEDNERATGRVSEHIFDLLLRQFFQASRDSMEAALRPLDYTPSQCGVLILLAKTPGLTSAELARQFIITPQAMGELVTNIEKAGLLYRQRHSKNARMQELHLTTEGHKAARECQKAMRGVRMGMLRLMDGADRKDFVRLLSLATNGLGQTTV